MLIGASLPAQPAHWVNAAATSTGQGRDRSRWTSCWQI